MLWDATLELTNRLRLKSLDSQFRTEVSQGLNCSPFEAEGVLEVVKEVFFPFLHEAAAKAPPGKITLVAVAADEPAGKPLANCRKVTVCLTVHRGESDDQLLIKQGAAAFRRARIAAICDEALSQDGLLTREDLAYRIFFISPRREPPTRFIVRWAWFGSTWRSIKSWSQSHEACYNDLYQVRG
jgi:hypothetical protein